MKKYGELINTYKDFYGAEIREYIKLQSVTLHKGTKPSDEAQAALMLSLPKLLVDLARRGRELTYYQALMLNAKRNLDFKIDKAVSFYCKSGNYCLVLRQLHTGKWEFSYIILYLQWASHYIVRLVNDVVIEEEHKPENVTANGQFGERWHELGIITDTKVFKNGTVKTCYGIDSVMSDRFRIIWHYINKNLQKFLSDLSAFANCAEEDIDLETLTETADSRCVIGTKNLQFFCVSVILRTTSEIISRGSDLFSFKSHHNLLFNSFVFERLNI